MIDVAWMERARCRDYDPELFFPVGNTGPALEQARRAIQICFACPVRRECLAYAMAGGMQGVWGGKTDVERARTVREVRGYVPGPTNCARTPA